MKKILNEYDDTKRMLNVLRGGLISEQLNEQIEGDTGMVDDDESMRNNSGNDVDVINDVDVRLISSDNVDLELTDDQRNEISNLVDTFRSRVSQTASLEPGFNFTNETIRLDGYIEEFDFKFHYIVGEGMGVYISGDMIRFENEALALLQNLIAFHEQFASSMDTMLRERQNN